MTRALIGADAAGAPGRLAFLRRDDAATELVRNIDWAATPLGPIERWPAPLITVLGLMLRARNPMLLYWGPELIHFFNTAFIPSLDERQFPASMGQRGAQAWSDIWPVIGPRLQAILGGGEATWDEDQLIPGLRHGRIVDIYWNYSFTPVADEHGDVAGILVVATETTARMLDQRRRAELHQVIERLHRIDPHGDDPHPSAVRALEPAQREVPCVMYLRCPPPGEAAQVLACSPGAEAQAAALARSLTGDTATRSALALGEAVHLPGRIALGVPSHPEPVTDVALLALRPAGQGPMECIAFGLNPRVPFDAPYRAFVHQLSDELSAIVLRGATSRERERALRNRDHLLRDAPVAISVLEGPELLFSLANARYCAMVARTEAKLLGRPFFSVFPEARGTELWITLQLARSQGQRYQSSETQVALRLPDGRLEDRFFDFSVDPLHDDTGASVGLITVALDITLQVQARRALERSAAERQTLLEQAQHAVRAKDEFLALLGHELRNPLAPIVSALHVMRARDDSSTRREQAVIGRQVEHLVRLVDDLLDVSRIARGRVRLEPSLTRAGVLLTRAVEMVQPLMHQRGHRLEVVMPRQPVLWWGDADRMVQVISNLLTNSARYTPPGGQVKVSADREGDELVIAVQDNGIGIAPEVLPGVFDLFSQGQPQGADRAAGGLGLGLALVKNLVALHGGRVEAHSAGLNQGARFVVRLPLREQPAAQAPTEAPAAADAAKQGRRVLLVDDQRDGAEMLGALLAMHGHQVRLAHDGPKAVEVAERFHPQVALLDIGLPGMDGYELARRLRARLGADCLLVALSGYGQPGDRERAIAAGFAHHLVKPADPARLLALIGAEAPSGAAKAP